MQALHEWCRQFLSKSKDVLIVANLDFAVHNHQFFREAHVICESKELLNQWVLSIVKARIGNVKFAQSAQNEIGNLEFLGELDFSLIYLNVSENITSVIENLYQLLADHIFPPLLIHTRESLDVLKRIGYNIHPVRGCSGVYLASDHPIYVKYQQASDPNRPKPKSDVTALLQNWRDKDTQEFIEDDWFNLIAYLRMIEQHADCQQCIRDAKPHISLANSYRLDFELGIVAFYLDQHDEGYLACERVINDPSTSEQVRNAAIKNQGYYVKLLAVNPVDLSRTHGVYKSSSPSILKLESGYLVNLRHVNYSITSNGSYIMRDPENIVRTTNYLIRLDENLNEIPDSETELLDVDSVRYACRIRGMEDVRLFTEKHFLCTCVDVNPQGIPQLCLGKFTPGGWVTKLLPVQVGDKLQVEKNWTPLKVLDGKLRFIYRFIPLQVYDMDLETGKCESYREIAHPGINPGLGFRGSAGMIPYKDGYLGIVHHVHYANFRNYFHRFVWLSEDLETMKYSRTWVFEKQHDIEYTLGIAHHKEGCVITYSIQDNCSKLCTVDYALIDRMLEL